MRPPPGWGRSRPGLGYAADERRRVFEVAQLVALAEIIGDFGKAPTWQEEIRIRLLPPWMLPVARRWADDWQGIYDWFLAIVMPEHPEGYAFGSWARDMAQKEVRRALDALVGDGGGEEVSPRRAGWINQP